MHTIFLGYASSLLGNEMIQYFDIDPEHEEGVSKFEQSFGCDYAEPGGNNATNVVEIDVPIGTTFYEGVAAPQGGLVGGGNQVFFDTKVDPSWKVSP